MGQNDDDPEKAIIPTVIFINSNHHSFGDNRTSGFMLCLGWWDFSIKLTIFFN